MIKAVISFAIISHFKQHAPHEDALDDVLLIKKGCSSHQPVHLLSALCILTLDVGELLTV